MRDSTRNDCEILEHYSATALFLACVRHLRPDFAPSNEEVPHIIRICRLLEGIPLGIELAAPWVEKLPAAQVADELAKGLDLLTTTLRDVPPRHRSMRAAFDRSWRLLSAHERSILRQLSVFRGGFTRKAAEAVAGATLADLVALADSSWLRAEPSGRYAVHELIRQYCGERLAAGHEAEADETADQVRARHGTYYAGTLTAQESQMNWQASVMAELGPEAGNLDAAWRWAVENGDYQTGRALVMGHFFVAEMEGRYHSNIQLLDDAAGLLRHWRSGGACLLPRLESGLLLGWVLFIQGALYCHLGMLARGRACIDESLEVLRDLEPDERQVEVIWIARDTVAHLLARQGDFAGAARLLRERLAYLQTTGGRCWPYVPEIGTQFIEANAYTALGLAMWSAGEYEEAQRLLRKSLDLRVRIGEQRQKAHGLSLLSGVLRTVGAYDEAERLARDSLTLGLAQGDRIGAALSREALGAVLMAGGRHAEATTHYEESLIVARETGNQGLLVRTLNGMGALVLVRGDLDEAGRFYEESRVSFERLGIVGTLGYAGACIGLGNVALAKRDLPRAKAHFREALAAPARRAWEKIDAVAGLAEAVALGGNALRAAELLALVAEHPFTAHVTREWVRALLEELAAELPADVFEAATARGRARQVDEVVAEIVGDQG